jgi:hypothetical protein
MAAGLGYKEFSTGDVLTAADANGYLASQVVMVFASAAARTSAIASPQEGMISFLKDTNSTEYYSGSAWVAIGGSAPAVGGAFSVYRTAAQTISGSTITKLQFNVEEYDANNNFDNATNYRFTPTVAGYYVFSLGIQPESGTDFYGYLYKNGSLSKRLWGGFGNLMNSGTAQVYLNGTTDYIEFYTACFSGNGNVYGGQTICWAMGSFMRGA